MAAPMGRPTTSFQRKLKADFLQIPGTRPSLHNNQLLVSTGIPSLDNVIGGGLAVGTVLLIEEDNYGNYSKVMLKYFLAEGIMTKQSLLLASADVQPQSILQELPGPLHDDPPVQNVAKSSAPSSGGGDEAMQIAWRYQNKPQVQSDPGTQSSRFGHYFDLTHSMSAEKIEATNKKLVHIDPLCQCADEKEQTIMKPAYAQLLHEIQSHIQNGGFSTTTKSQKNILRIGVHSLGSPLWGEEGGMASGKPGLDPSLPRFLYALRSLLRSAFAVCLITVPTHLFHELAMLRRVEHLCDTVVHLESFAGSDRETNPAFREYHGLFNIRKLPRLNSLICHMPDTMDLAFKLKRKKFMIEKLHLPPELSETANRNQEDPVAAMKPKTSICGTGGGKSKIDF